MNKVAAYINCSGKVVPFPIRKTSGKLADVHDQNGNSQLRSSPPLPESQPLLKPSKALMTIPIERLVQFASFKD